MPADARRKWTVLLLLLGGAVVAMALAPLMGAQWISPVTALRHDPDDVASVIFWEIRLPRVCLSFLAGAALAVSGMAFQAMFRNPLATPFTLGVASGASLGAALCVRFGLVFTVLGISTRSVMAFAGALLAILMVYGLTRLRRGFSTSTMLLAGVAMSLFFSSVILFAQYMTDLAGTRQIFHRLIGGLEVAGFDEVLNVLPIAVTGIAVIIYLTNELNLMMSGEEIAVSRGAEVAKVKKILFLVTSLMVGGVVAVCGPIGFVGMMVPHMCRLVLGADHRWLTPATALFGGVFLTCCDLIARTIIAPATMPVGIITALLGGPFFVWLLVRKSAPEKGMI